MKNKCFPEKDQMENIAKYSFQNKIWNKKQKFSLGDIFKLWKRVLF